MTGDWLATFKEWQAVLSGHFILTSGLHSDTYFQMALVFQYPHRGAEVARALARRLGELQPDVVIGPATGGILLSYELSRILGGRSIFAERQEGAMTLRRGFSLREGERVLVCEDVITTGGSVKEVVNLVRERKADVVGIAAIVERGQAQFEMPVTSLVKVSVRSFAPETCPLCAAGSDAVKPGSRGLK